ncbi:hypothetical protein C8Q74DRAFT_1365216 [Fomes fomentarius]|nr:hypothetical protein C8Q74DRAFT_1365216 [Fomes fomentarius]
MPALVNTVLSTSFPPPDPPAPQEGDKEFTRFLVDTTSASVEDLGVLQSRMVAMQRESSQSCHYARTSDISILQLTLAHLPGYEKVLELGRMRKNPILLDIGCGFGIDIRKAIQDGYPASSAMATGFDSDIWKLGLELFRSRTNNYDIPFVAGDLFDPYFLEAVYPFYTIPNSPAPSLSSLTSLNLLHGQVSIVSACHVFHRFDEAHQLQLARAISGLLSPQPGSMILGVHSARPNHGRKLEPSGEGAVERFYHSPKSWTELWDGGLFQKDTVKVEARLVELEGGASEDQCIMEWSVTRM